jgi:hypothetical protein
LDHRNKAFKFFLYIFDYPNVLAIRYSGKNIAKLPAGMIYRELSKCEILNVVLQIVPFGIVVCNSPTG